MATSSLVCPFVFRYVRRLQSNLAISRRGSGFETTDPKSRPKNTTLVWGDTRGVGDGEYAVATGRRGDAVRGSLPGVLGDCDFGYPGNSIALLGGRVESISCAPCMLDRVERTMASASARIGC